LHLFGIPVAKMSGRGLGFTGGTVDKLEAIPGYNVNIDIPTFINNVKKIGISLIGQTKNLAPADKKIYSLRDAIGCVENIPLISSSVMSKKIASGAKKIVLDITVGSGAFMKTVEQAEQLSRMMTRIGKLAGVETTCIITDMDQPLGRAVGNTLEVIEAMDALQGNMEKDVEEVIYKLGEAIGISKEKILEQLQNGKAYEKFLEMVKNQGGDISKLGKAKYVIPVVSEKTFTITKLNAEDVGNISVRLGAGRVKKEDPIDYTVGIILNKKVGDSVNEGEVLAYIHANDEELGKKAVEDLKKVYYNI